VSTEVDAGLADTHVYTSVLSTEDPVRPRWHRLGLRLGMRTQKNCVISLQNTSPCFPLISKIFKSKDESIVLCLNINVRSARERTGPKTCHEYCLINAV
jgi:hypothetical protein